jgi:predicted CXXCH cytochrome family protein
MMDRTWKGLRGALSLFILGVVCVSCVDETVVFRDRELFEDPLPAAMSFLGYTSSEDKLTVCGNCHVGPQSEWEETAHADAWEGLQASPGAQEFCEGCHTVSALGNATTGIAGHAATGEERYQDVQCESCHGPGLAHVLDPKDETVPMAALDVGVDLTLGCAQCHQGDHHPFAEEWKTSGHASVVGFAADRPECTSCHSGEGALDMFGVNTIYTEQMDVAQPGEHVAITCAVCHDPHGSDNRAQLRFPIDVPNEEVNLCMQCHQKRGTPDPTTFRGPHSPEGPTLLGTAGWWPPNLDFVGGSIRATHGTEANPTLCAGCHVNSFTVTDAVTDEFVFQSTGHRFEATPCLDGAGVATEGPCDFADESYLTCTSAGCHGTEAVARSAEVVVTLRIESLVTELQGLIDLIPASEFDPDDARYTVGEGSLFNLELAEAPGAMIHNPFLIEALLIASINVARDTYMLPMLSDVSLTRELGTR